MAHAGMLNECLSNALIGQKYNVGVRFFSRPCKPKICNDLLTSCICLFIVIQCTFIMIVNVFIPGPYWKPTFVAWATLVKYCE